MQQEIGFPLKDNQSNISIKIKIIYLDNATNINLN